MTIDLNCDMGESFGNYKIGNDDLIFPYITSCNVACGFHGGDPFHIENTIKKAIQYGVQVGGHPSYPDLQGFGRRKMSVPAVELKAIIKYQIAAIKGITESHNGKMTYVKPHGALYNTAASDEKEASIIIQAIQEIDENIAIMGLAGSTNELLAKEMGIRFIAEAFADRRYTADGRLMSRSKVGAVLHKPEDTASQVLSMVKQKTVTADDGSIIPLKPQTICIHGDNPKVVDILKAIHQILKANQIGIKAF